MTEHLPNQGSDSDDPSEALGPDRRSLLTKGAIAAAVAAAAGVSLSSRASAANGDTMIVGVANSGTSTTQLMGGSTFQVWSGTSAGDASIYGVQDATAAFGVRGSNVGGGGAGVYGEHSGSTVVGTGVIGRTQGIGTGSYDLQAAGRGRIGITGSSSVGPATSGAVGTIARDSSGGLWYCYATNKWEKIGGPGTAGAFHPVNPARVFDSRLPAYPNNGLLAPNTSKVVSVKDARSSAGAITITDLVPVGATAVAINVTVTGTTSSNFVSVTPGDAASYTASSINWVGAGVSLANALIVKLDASRQIKLWGGDQPGSTHVIIDLAGYWL
jgi:hypothetical protein